MKTYKVIASVIGECCTTSHLYEGVVKANSKRHAALKATRKAEQANYTVGDVCIIGHGPRYYSSTDDRS